MDRIADVWGSRTPHGRGTHWPVRVDQQLADGIAESDVDRWVQSACVLCSNGCGCDIAVRDGRIVGVRGRADDIVNRGRLGPKGLYGSWQAHGKDRLTTPLLHRDGKLRETDWDTAMSEIVRRSQDLLAESGALSHGFYTSGQLFLEEYYTLGMIGKAGIGTPHMDGNTRLCTATAAAALKESFGSDGQPACHADVDLCDALFLFGHNMAATQTVLWARVLDRMAGPGRPRLVVVDPRRTPTAEAADVHLAPLPGTNQALLNGLVRALIENGWVDRDYVDQHTLGFEELKATVEPYTPEHVAGICRVSPADLVRTAEIFGTSDRVLSTVLQGFYQSHQATAASCQVNNLHLLRGQIGGPGSGVMQMNGQPTAQNTRECGADGDLPGFRNWDNPEHVEELARLWNVDPLTIPHWAPPTHAMQIWRYAEQGSIRFLWISATNPAVSLPELGRIREILRREDLFVVAQDAFRTETTELADVVLPAALWGEKQGTFTNLSRVVHLSEQAVAPPAGARSDLDIFLDYADRMGFRDRNDDPLIKWKDAEGAFDAWRECSRGRPCDYSELSYERLRGGSGIPWGGERLYADGVFPTAAGYCEDYGHDLLTGASTTPTDYQARRPDGRAFLKAAEYTPAPEQPSDEYPFLCTTGRSVYHFHSRTKTRRAPELQKAAPDPWVELSPADADELGLSEGDVVRVESERGFVEVPVRIGRCRDGVVFLPFHYGFQAANELTPTEWDPVSKQPLFKISTVRIRRV
ncbi:molybdopterin oxidoreductase family protein [Lentzea albidocapillata]|uniref:molybdopterin oxidoreductase family protein n=1 Tax=Lentzea albidocapillata TaxID=40571 RepID=UPI000A3EC9A5|nr:nitrate reductase [Lentzea albidocapillata]